MGIFNENAEIAKSRNVVKSTFPLFNFKQNYFKKDLLDSPYHLVKTFVLVLVTFIYSL